MSFMVYAAFVIKIEIVLEIVYKKAQTLRRVRK